MFKNLKYTLGLLVTAILLAFAGAKAAKRTKRAEIRADKATDYTYANQNAKAEKEIAAADRDKKAAEVARNDLEKHLQTLAEANSDIDTIATRWNSKRMRFKPKAIS